MSADTITRHANTLAEKRGAEFSRCENYRYQLWRIWDEKTAPICVIGLNPSTATEAVEDPTVRRCLGLARRLGAGGLYMLNLFAVRATDPRVMLAHPKPVGGPLTDERLAEIAARCSVRVAAWGTKGGHLDRDKAVLDLIPDLHCLRVTSGGFPEHPLYLPSLLQPVPYAARNNEVPA